MPSTVKRILTIYANPRGTSPLRLAEEQRVISQCIERSRTRARIRIETRNAATIDDFSRALLDTRCDIVHLSGHGTKQGFALEDDHGRLFVPPPAALAQLLHDHSPPIQCVILNSCYSLTEGILTALGVPYTIASERPLADEAAIEFTRGFYDAFGAGRDVQASYDEGIRRCLLKGMDPRRLPTLLRQNEVLQLPRERLPIALEDGSVVLPSEIVSEGECRCDRDFCVDSSEKMYCVFTRELQRWIINKGLYWRCYDELVRCPRCRKQHKRGHVGRRGFCSKPYKHQILQRD